jgi:hypothetical protein
MSFRNAANDGGEVTLWVKNCLADRWLARLLYPQRPPREPFVMEPVEGQKLP